MPHLNNSTKRTFSFLHFLQLVFLSFSLFLMGDAFYRWDGFRLYMSFSEFLPSFALALILWSILAFLTAFIGWIGLRSAEKACALIGLKTRTEHFLLFTGAFAVLALSTWAVKKHIFSYVHASFPIKVSLVILLICIAGSFTWLFRKKAEQWLSSLQQHFAPLIWLFGILTLLSVPLLFFTTLSKGTGPTQAAQTIQEPSDKADEDRPNIILLTFDSLTARNMSAYGYDRPTTPFIDRWAEAASQFTKVEAESNFTAPTTASLITGKRVWTHRRYHHAKGAKPYKSDSENLALLMRNNGYYNLAFITNFVASVEALNIDGSFDIAPSYSDLISPATFGGFLEAHLYGLFGDTLKVHNWLGQDDFIFNKLLRKIPQRVTVTEYPLDRVFNAFFKEVENIPSEHFFTWIHVMPPHIPFLPPEPFAGRFNSSNDLRSGNAQFSIRDDEVRDYEHKDLPYPKELQDRIDILRDYYDEYILYCDEQLKYFIEELKNRNLYDNTVIILSSDHGESFEHNYFTHGKKHLYEQVTHIPLIIKEPGQTRGLVIHDLVEQIDIPATVLALADIEIPAWMEGRSLVPLMHGMKMEPRPAYALSFTNNAAEDPIIKGTIAVWQDDYKLIHYLGKDRSLLYNLTEDPSESDNISASEPEIFQQLLGQLKDRLAIANERILTNH